MTFLPEGVPSQYERAGVSPPLGVSRRARILIADDDPGTREVLTSLIQDLGYEAQAVPDGAMALAAVAAQPPALGRALGLPEDDPTALRWGGYLHDLGKVGIPEAILMKEGRLTPEERRVMERHPLTARILAVVANGRQ